MRESRSFDVTKRRSISGSVITGARLFSAILAKRALRRISLNSTPNGHGDHVLSRAVEN